MENSEVSSPPQNLENDPTQQNMTDILVSENAGASVIDDCNMHGNNTEDLLDINGGNSNAVQASTLDMGLPRANIGENQSAINANVNSIIGPVLKALSIFSKPHAMKTPVLQGSDPKAFKEWKQQLKYWKKQCGLPEEEMGVRIAGEGLPQGSKAAEIVARLDEEIIESKEGVKHILDSLDKHFLPSVVIQAFQATYNLFRFDKPVGTSAKEGANEFMKLYEEFNKFGGNLETVIALMMLYSQHLTAHDNQTILSNATQGGKTLTVEGMYNSIVFYFSMEEIKKNKTMGESSFSNGNEIGRNIGSDNVGVLYTDNRGLRGAMRSQFRGRTMFRGKRGGPYSQPRGHSRLEERQLRGRSRFYRGGYTVRCFECGDRGHISKDCLRNRCHTCGERDHYKKDCPNQHNKVRKTLIGNSFQNVSGSKSQSETRIPATKDGEFFFGNSNWDKDADIVHVSGIEIQQDNNEEKVNFFVGCTNNKTSNSMKQLVYESQGHAVLDSGCATNVCGENWLLDYINKLGDGNKEEIKSTSSKRLFAFGGGQTIPSKGKYQIPIWIAGVKAKLETEVVVCDIPLLLSRETMELQNFVLNFGNRTVFWNGKTINLLLTSTGHYGLPIHI